MKTVIGYAVFLVLAFLLAGVCGLVLVKGIRVVTKEVSKTLNAKQGA